MTLSPFSTISSYAAMLNKIATATFSVSVVAFGLLYWQVPAVSGFVPSWPVKIPETEVEVPLVVLVGALAFALFSRAIKLHDRLSDLFGIRDRFDVQAILLPMAAASGAALSLGQQVTVRE